MMYAVAMKPRDRMGVFRRSVAHMNCNVTTPRTQYLVNVSGPQSLSTSKQSISWDAIGLKKVRIPLDVF